MMATKKRGLGLGRGLDVLLGTQDTETPAANGEGELRQLAVGSITSGKYQPRRTFDDDKLDELAASIRTQGVLEPVIVRAIDDRAAIAIALIENIQREDLSPLEEAQSLARLIEEFKLTHQQTADAIGRSRAAVSNLLRLLELPADIRTLLDERKLDMGHARALLTLPAARATALAREAVAKGWSVRELEDAVRGSGDAKKKPAAPAKAKADANIAALESSLAERLGARVALNHGRNGRGKVVIHYHSLDELDGILEKIR